MLASPSGHCIATADVADAQGNKVATKEFAVQGKVEQGKFPDARSI